MSRKNLTSVLRRTKGPSPKAKPDETEYASGVVLVKKHVVDYLGLGTTIQPSMLTHGGIVGKKIGMRGSGVF